MVVVVVVVVVVGVVIWRVNILGGPKVFEAFLKAYITKFEFQSITSAQWKDFLFQYFNSEADRQKLNSVPWDAWFYAEGMPDIQPQFDSSLARPCHDLCTRWLAAGDSDLLAFSAEDLADFSSLQRREFVSLLLQ
ncbi:hypothetical protein ACOMHN_030162 [Nucella lapillus]